ncbi:MAG: CheR family methyltransferase, partial [Dissulfurispiraceae bacterium]
STKVLETARAGIYGYEQLPDNIPKDIVGRYFLRGIDENEGKIKVKDFLKGIVRLGRLNFTEKSYPFNKEFDVIFFRNVMIYFDEEMKRHVISMFHRHLCGNGHLLLGHSETMFWNEEFVPVDITVYRKR